mgnify:CR=1 FL=1
MSRSVNTVWNGCREIQEQAFSFHHRWLSRFDLQNLCKGTSKELGIAAATVQMVCQRYNDSRRTNRKARLRWRGKKSLGWVPLRGDTLKIERDMIRYAGHTFRFWNSRPLPGPVKTGCFSQDARGRWYVSLQCEVKELEPIEDSTAGIDLGLKTLATLSDGKIVENPRFFRTFEQQLGDAQRKKQKRRVRKIHACITNSRKDFLHKETTKLANSYSIIVVGDISSKKLKKTRMAKSVSDIGWSMFRTFLEYKMRLRAGKFISVNERNTTRACSCCGGIPASAPKGRKGLSIREWQCSDCGTSHDRDHNAAQNILALGVSSAG